jgi:hypothetical protein
MYWVECVIKLHQETDELGRSIHAVQTLGLYVSDPGHQRMALQAAITKNPNHQRLALEAAIKKDPNHQSNAGRKGGLVQGKRNVDSGQFEACKKLQFECLVTGHISNSGGLSRYQQARGIDTKLRKPHK